MQYRLALETSSAMGEVALGMEHRVIAVHELSAPRRHAAEFIPALASLCREHNVTPAAIEAVFVSAGPGSFTGLRIGVTAARMLNLAGGCTLVPVATLEAIAQNARLPAPQLDGGRHEAPERVVAMLDAKRGHVYAATFILSGDLYKPVAEPVEAEPFAYLRHEIESHGECAAIGEGVRYHETAVVAAGANVLPQALDPPQVRTVYRLGCLRLAEFRTVDRRAFTPIYVRPPEAEEKWLRRQLAADKSPPA